MNSGIILIDVIIVCYKSQATIAETLNNLSGFTDERYRLIVHLIDCSNETEMLVETIRQYPGLECRVHRNNSNKGYAGANNKVLDNLDQSHSENKNSLVLILNPDVSPSHDIISMMASIAASNEQIFSVFPSECSNFEKQYQKINRDCKNRRRYDYTGHKIKYTEILGEKIADTVADATGACLMLKPWLIGLPVFDEKLFMYMEETLLVIRARKLELCNYRLLDRWIEHNKDESWASRRRCYYTARNSIKILKYLGWHQKIILLTARYFKPMITMGPRLVISGSWGLISASVHGLVDGIRGKTGVCKRYHD